MNVRNPQNITTLQAAVLIFQQEDRVQLPEEDRRAPAILEILLEFGADPALNIPHNPGATPEQQSVFDSNGIAYAAAKGILSACAMMFAKSPECVNAPTGDGLQHNAFSIALLQLDNPLPADHAAKVLEENRQADCKKLVELFAPKYNLNTPLSVVVSPLEVVMLSPLEVMVMKNRPEATKLLFELGANPSSELVKLAADNGSDKVLPVIKEFHPEYFTQPQAMDEYPLLVAMRASRGGVVNVDTAKQYENTLKFLVQDKYPDGNGIIATLSLAIKEQCVFALHKLTDLWVTKFDALAGKTPLMLAMENLKTDSLCKEFVSYIANLPPETRDQMPEFGKALLTLDDNHINIPYLQYRVAPNAPGGVGKVFLKVPCQNEAPLLKPLNIAAEGPSNINGKMIRVWHVQTKENSLTHALKNRKDREAQEIIAKENLNRFADDTKSEHLHWAAQFANYDTVHNLISKEHVTINLFNSFLKNPLLYAINRYIEWDRKAREAREAKALEEVQALEIEVKEARYVIAEIAARGGRAEGIKVTVNGVEREVRAAEDEGVEDRDDISYILNHARGIVDVRNAEIHAQGIVDARNAEIHAMGVDDGLGIGELDVAA